MEFHIDPATHIGIVTLRVSDLARSLNFYKDVLGFTVVRRSEDRSTLAAGDLPLLRLEELAGAKPRPNRSTGLYHFAILTPNRAALAASFQQLIKSGYPLTGAADHLVSEALYLSDPDKNGIEIYRDRAKEDWTFDGPYVEMANDPVDLDSLFREGGNVPFNGLQNGTTMGHVHLHVRDLQEAEEFYCGVLGFDVTLRWEPSALFVSAGGYHHHIGLNVWAGVGAPPPPKDAAGLIEYQIVLPDDGTRRQVLDRLVAQGIDIQDGADGMRFSDPSQNGIHLAIAS